MYGVDTGVWKAVIGKRKVVTPALVALASAQCPELLSDGWRRRSERIQVKPFESLHDTERSDVATECYGDFAQPVVRRALAEWAIMGNDAIDVLYDLARWDHKLTTWCGCAIAETVLNFFPAGERRPRLVIETARAWASGRATIEQVRIAREGAMKVRLLRFVSSAFHQSGYRQPAIDSIETVDMTGFYAGLAVLDPADGIIDERVGYGYVGYAGDAARHAADYMAYAAGFDYESDKSNWHAARDAELKRLCEVVANAITNYPSADLSGPSSGTAARNRLAAAAGLLLGAGAMYAARR